MEHIQHLINLYPLLSSARFTIEKAFEIIKDCYTQGGKLLIAGNGGSAADADHIVGELMKNFIKKRNLDENFIAKIKEASPEYEEYLIDNLEPGLPAINLASHVSLSTATMNDVDGNSIFAQQVLGYGNKNDVLLCISTSGNSKNILYAAATAKAKDMKVIALTGRDGGRLKYLADASIIIPLEETYKIQEFHVPVYHCLCLMIEEHFFP